MSLQQLREKYGLGPGAKYDPNPDCTWCKGTGERPVKDGLSFCGCLYIEHSFSNMALNTLEGIVRRIRSEMRLD